MNILLIILIYVILSFFCFHILNFFFHKYQLLDFPNHRKLHSKPVPYVGGIAILIIYCLSIYLFDYFDSYYSTIIFFGLFTCLINLIDDIIDLDFKIKLFLQLLICLIFIYLTKIYVYDLGYIESYGQINLGPYGIFFTIICVMIIMNSLNYFDGIDGLSSSIYLISIFNLFLFSFSFNDYLNIYLFLCLPIIIFLFYNFEIFKLPKIFLGNNGSSSLGFILGFLCISAVFIENTFIHSEIIWLLWLLVYEFLSTTISRLLNKKNPFQPGHDHIHFGLSNLFKSSKKGYFILIIFYEIICIFGFIISSYGIFYSYLIFFIFFLPYHLIRENIINYNEKFN